MIAFDDTREMERRASVCYGDGLLEIGLGFGLFLVGFAMIIGLGALGSILAALGVPLGICAKRSITVPRMHHLDFMPEPGAESRRRRGLIVAAAACVVLLAIGILALLMSRWVPARVSHGLHDNALVIFGCMLSVFFVLAAWGAETKRLRNYAGAALIMLVCGYWFDLAAAWYLMMLGCCVAVCGSIVLSRFIRDYPRFHSRNGRVYQRSF